MAIKRIEPKPADEKETKDKPLFVGNHVPTYQEDNNPPLTYEAVSDLAKPFSEDDAPR
jgi:hypothetical protein